ncbi:MAG TPA: LytR C-terminal domain-containing protein, partial [Acidimicrobiales bacterium]
PSLGVMLIILVLFVGITFIALRGHSTSHPTTATTQPKSTTTTGTKSTSTTVPKSQVSVQVANGTTTSGLASTYTTKLQLLGWNTLPRVNGPAETATVIYYHPAFLWAAQEIATEIGVPASAARPLGTATPVPGATGDDIVVILGPDVAG